MPHNKIDYLPTEMASIQKTPRFRGRPCVLSLVGKGGAAKSTTSIQLAGIGAACGHRVLILDTDPQRSVTQWRSLRKDGSIGVRSCRPQEVAQVVKQAGQSGFDLVLIDNAPVRNDASASIAELADLSLVMVRPSMLDLLVGMDWIAWIKSTDKPFVVVIGAAPSVRNGKEAPFMRDSRAALENEVERVWRGQITLRHAVIDSVGSGATLMEVDPAGTAAAEFCRLWNALMTEVERTR